MGGKNIRIFLVDGMPAGILTAEIMNWTGKVVVTPLSQLPALAQRPEVKRTGVYFLVGPDPEAPHKDRVYIGESDNVFTRLIEHVKDETKGFSKRAAIIISKDENLTKSHARYLEERLVAIANEAGHAVVANGNTPPGSSLPEPDVADMEYFLEQIRMIMPVLGFPFLQPKPTYAQATDVGAGVPRFVMRDAGTEAHAAEIDGEFVVLNGSTARKQPTPSLTSYVGLRDQLVNDGVLVDGPDPLYYVFTKDWPFTSPSAAATVVAAGNRGGRLAWKVEATGQTYAEWQDAKLAKATENQM